MGRNKYRKITCFSSIPNGRDIRYLSSHAGSTSPHATEMLFAETPLSTPWNGLVSLDDGAWLTSLWQWLTTQSLTISVPLEPPGPTYEGDICIMDHYTSHQLSLLSPNNVALLERHARGQTVEITDVLRRLIANVQSLQNHLLREDILWVSEMTEPRHRTHAATNRILKPEFSYFNNGKRKCEWVKTILGGTPGLFSHTLQCEFLLVPNPQRRQLAVAAAAASSSTSRS